MARTSGNQYGQITLEDFSGEISIMFMGKTYLANREHLVADQTVSVRGRVSRRDEEMMMQAYSIDILDAGREQGGVLKLKITDSRGYQGTFAKAGCHS